MLKNHLNKLKNIRKRHESTKTTETIFIKQKHLLSELLHKTPCISKSTLQRYIEQKEYKHTKQAQTFKQEPLNAL